MITCVEDFRPVIDGEAIDLQNAAELQITPGHARIVADGGRFFLDSPALDGLDGAALVAAAENELELINGTAAIVHANYRPITVSGELRSPDGTVSRVVRVTFHAEARLSATVSMVGPGSSSTSVPATLTLAANQEPETFGRALKLMGSNSLDWITLWKVYDVIRHGTTPPEGKYNRKHITTRSWATTAELDSFELSANDPQISGNDARHGAYRMTKEPKLTDPMTTVQARELISRILCSWAEEIAPTAASH